MHSPFSNRSQHGTSLIEVLVTLVVLATGMMGLVGLQSRLQVSELESYQRAQAVILLEDMTSRMSINRSNALNYETTTALGSGSSCPATSTTQQQRDTREWCNALLGAAETSGSSKIGAMINARGCVENLGNNVYMVSVVWQGMISTTALPTTVSCGVGNYGGGACTGETCRRGVTAVLNLSPLS